MGLNNKLRNINFILCTEGDTEGRMAGKRQSEICVRKIYVVVWTKQIWEIGDRKRTS